MDFSLRLLGAMMLSTWTLWPAAARGGGGEADVSIVVDDGTTVVQPLGPIAWTITVHNAGPDDAIAQVADTFPDVVSDIAWQCTPSGSAVCAADGTGDISDLVSIPAGDSLVYVASGVVEAALNSTVSNTALVATLNGIVDPDSSNNVSTDIDQVAYTEPPIVGKVDSVPVAPESCGLPDGIEMRTNPTQIELHFSQAMLNPAGDTEPVDVTNPDNYRVIEAGSDGVFTTADCASAPTGDDVTVALTGLDYDDGTNLVALHVDPDMKALPAGSYRVIACGAGLADASGILLDGARNGSAGSDFRSDFRILGSNLLVNPNFDHPLANGWTWRSGYMLDDPADADGSPFSGSVAEPGATDTITIHDMIQCVSGIGAGYYTLSFRTLNNRAGQFAQLYSDNACVDSYDPFTSLFTGLPSEVPGAWDLGADGPLKLVAPIPPGGFAFRVEARLEDVPMGTTARMDSWTLRKEDDDILFRSGTDFPTPCTPP